VECGEGKYFCHQDQKCKPIPKGYKVTMPDGILVKEGNLHKWFSKSKSKDGKKGWVNVVTGGTCASDKPGEGTPKCVSSAKRASMSKAERLSAQRRKKKADPNQQSKSGAAKPTYVRTDSKKKMKEEVKRDEYGDPIGGPKISKKQLKKNLAKNEPDYKIVRSEAAAWTRKAGKNKEGGLNEKGRKSYERENPGSDLKAPSKKVGNPRRKSFCARMKGMKKKLTSAKTARDPDSRINKSLRAWNCSYEWPKDKEMIETTSLKNEILAKAQEKHSEAKKKKYKQIMDAGKAAKEKVGKDPRGVRALSKGKWGYVKNNSFTPD